MLSLLLVFLLMQSAQTTPATGTVSGRVLALDGKPAANVRVMAIAVASRQAGGDVAILSIAQSDTAGRYRLEAVPPGRYYIAAGLVELPSYYPGANRHAAAEIVAVASGGSLEGIDFVLAAPLTLRVKGRIVRANAGPASVGPGHEVRLSASTGQSWTAPIADDGSFEFVDVRPAVYTLRARGSLTTSSVSVVVTDKDVTDADLVLTPIKTVTGRVVVEGDGPVPRFALLTVEPADPLAGGAATLVKTLISTTRVFTLRLPEGEQPLSVSQDSLPRGYSVKALRYGNRDLLKQPFRVAMSDTAELVVTLQSPRRRRVEVSGRVAPYDSSFPTAVVALESPAFVEKATALVAPDGSFRFRDVMPERYTISSTLSGASAPAIVVDESDVTSLIITVPSLPTADSEKIIGSLSWIIYEAFSGAIVDRGNGPVRVKDVKVSERGLTPPDLRTQKAIALNDRFSLIMDESVTEWKTEKTRLTLSVRHKDYQTVSYESFRIHDSTRATSQQGAGELGISVVEVVPRRWEFSRTEFLTDMPIRVTHAGMVPPGAPYWRVVILKGSRIDWPSFINGKVVSK